MSHAGSSCSHSNRDFIGVLMSKQQANTRDCSHAPLVYVDEDGVERWVSSGLDALGRELPDSVPFAPPVGMGQHMTLADTMRHMLHHQKLRELADAEGFDSEEEANDFEVEDEPLAPGTTLFEAWADLAERGLVEPPPAPPGGNPPGPPAAPPPDPIAETPSSPTQTAEEGGSAGGGVPPVAPAAPPPARPPRARK